MDAELKSHGSGRHRWALASASSTEGEFESKLRDAHIRTQALEAQVTALEGERDQASQAVMQAGEEKRKMEATHAAFTQKMTQEMCSRDGQLAALNGQIDALKHLSGRLRPAQKNRRISRPR